MARKKTNKFIDVFKIFFSSLHSYFLYLDQTTKFLLFPIFGQLISTVIIFTLTYLYVTNYDALIGSCKFFSSGNNLFITFLIILIPLLLILTKSIYDYIIAFTSLNLLFYTQSNKKAVKNIDFKANNNVIQRKLFPYIVLMVIVSVIVPFLNIFLCLVFQVFAFEGEISPFKAISRSIQLVKSNIIPTLTLLIICFVTTYLFVPGLLIWACQKTSIYYFLMNNCEKFLTLFPINDLLNNINPLILSVAENEIKEILSPVSLSRNITNSLLSFIIIGFTLPLRCCCFTELYKLYDSEKIKENSKNTEEIIKRATSKKRKN